MKINFEYVDQISDLGSQPTLAQFWDNQVQVFYIKNNKLMSKIGKVKYEEGWNNIEFIREKELIKTNYTTFYNISHQFDDIIIGTINDGMQQKVIIYEY